MGSYVPTAWESMSLGYYPRYICLWYTGQMVKHTKVVVYVRANDVRALEARGEEPAEFIRKLVRRALDRLQESQNG